MVGDPVARQFENMRISWPWVTARGPGARVIERPGVTATIAPAVPARSMFNAVFYSDAARLEEALPDLAEVYEREGVEAFTVWIPEHDQRALDLVQREGHVLDATPAAMEAGMDELSLPEPGDLDWTRDLTFPEANAVNNRAYPMTGEPFTSGGAPDSEGGHLYGARLDGEIASVVGILDVGEDAAVVSVATLPEARGRGLAARLMGVALREARERGARGTSLQATAAGEPVYLRLGYRIPFRFGMWERRGPK